MCGIAGLIGEPDVAIAELVVGRMTAALARRGPDDQGLELWPGAALGHRRLSIYDLSAAGHQPMLMLNGQTGVVFNGAIYNYRELSHELSQHGCRFRSSTDTEVLLQGYRVWGIDKLVSRLRGMFAFGLWDNREQRLFLVRDRLGVKPLLYARCNGRLAFASTARALRVGGFAAETDAQAITEYLEFGFVTDARSIYRGVAKVPPATIVEWADGKLCARQYWNLPETRLTDAPTFAEAVEETERLFIVAVEKRLHADVPVGTLLSGGIDSGLVCWAVSKLGGNVTAFTIGTPGDPWDETADASATAAELKIPHRVIELSAEDEPDIRELVTAYGEPFACASALGMLRVSHAVKSAATVLLTGDGGDDVFLGYPEHRSFWVAEKIARSLPDRAALLWAAARGAFPDSGSLRRIKSFLDYTTGGLAAAVCARDGLPMYSQKGIAGEQLMKAELWQRLMPWSIASARQLLSEFLKCDLHTRLTGEYLTKVDGATMHYALEARSPFLDQELWEFAATLPFDLRLSGGRLKAILREMARRRLGERVARGRKRGFSIPVQRWIAGRWLKEVKETLYNSILGSEGWICEEAVLALADKSALQGEAPKQLWYLFVLESWLKRERDQVA